jgi:hypothetical protein
MLRIVACTLGFALVPSLALASAPSLTPSQIVTLVKATPQLKINRNVSPSPAFDPATNPYVDVVGAPEGQAVGGYLAPQSVQRGTLTSGYDVLAVPLDSGGSGGVFTQIIFARRGGAFAYVGHIDSAGHLGVRIEAGKIVATLPYYAAKDANCCPSKFIVQTYTIRDGKLQRTSQRTIPTPKPSP